MPKRSHPTPGDEPTPSASEILDKKTHLTIVSAREHPLISEPPVHMQKLVQNMLELYSHTQDVLAVARTTADLKKKDVPIPIEINLAYKTLDDARINIRYALDVIARACPEAMQTPENEFDEAKVTPE